MLNIPFKKKKKKRKKLCCKKGNQKKLQQTTILKGVELNFFFYFSLFSHLIFLHEKTITVYFTSKKQQLTKISILTMLFLSQNHISKKKRSFFLSILYKRHKSYVDMLLYVISSTIELFFCCFVCFTLNQSFLCRIFVIQVMATHKNE